MKYNIFHKIINNKIECYKLAEDYNHIAFLDIFPLKIGHTLVIPKNIYKDKIFSLSEKNYISIMIFSRKVAIGLEKSIPCKRIGMFIMGFEIPHIHIHLIPMDKESDCDFFKKRISLSKNKMNFLSKRIKKFIIL
ncbi:HIT family protein [Blattabacterium cuenoti]|uniref:HIT family protein n=1 Tax=Blattabacterium cuenoti TaxID=1653831 RepID=UPI00163B682E|nr:HIT domain-containing protein [Blattabacterium cuenoti]